jgi:hypothetical protein
MLFAARDDLLANVWSPSQLALGHFEKREGKEERVWRKMEYKGLAIHND